MVHSGSASVEATEQGADGTCKTLAVQAALVNRKISFSIVMAWCVPPVCKCYGRAAFFVYRIEKSSRIASHHVLLVHTPVTPAGCLHAETYRTSITGNMFRFGIDHRSSVVLNRWPASFDKSPWIRLIWPAALPCRLASLITITITEQTSREQRR